MRGPLEPGAIHVWRDGYVESRHEVAFAIARPDGTLVAASGDPNRPLLPRSAIKPIQALPLVTSGAATAFALEDREIALACGSHSGSEAHVAAVGGWLRRLGLDDADLRCGAHPPTDPDAREHLQRAAQRPGPQHNNCSGKHAGMLTLARHLGAPLDDYRRPDHAVQRAVAGAIHAMTGVDQLAAPAIDGCGVPTWPLPIGALARAMARFADPDGLDPQLQAAVVRIRRAMQDHPEMVAGPGRLCTELGRACPSVIAKTGAEGVYTAILTQARLGLALKVEDGAGRAAGVALLALLERLGALDPSALDRLVAWQRPVIENHAGLAVGSIAPAPDWPQFP